MSRHKSRVPGMRTAESFRIPRCSVHGKPTVRGANGQYVCPECLEDHVKGLVTKTAGGVDLPDGVRDERIPTFRELLPNRAMRRRTLR